MGAALALKIETEADEPPWFVIQTHPGDEFLASLWLERKGREVFLPLVWTRYTARGREHGRQVPLYAGYLFMRACDSYSGIVGLPGVARILGEDDKPGTVSDDVIRHLDRSMRMGGGAIILDWQPKAEGYKFKPGEPARIINGPWTGLIGYFKSDQNGRARIDIDFFGRVSTISIPQHYLAPLVSGSAAA